MHFNLRYLSSPGPTDAVICTWNGNSHTCYTNTKCFRSISIRVWLHDAAPGRLWNTLAVYVYKVKNKKLQSLCSPTQSVRQWFTTCTLNAQISPLYLAEITHRGASLIRWLHAWVHVSIKGKKIVNKCLILQVYCKYILVIHTCTKSAGPMQKHRYQKLYSVEPE